MSLQPWRYTPQLTRAAIVGPSGQIGDLLRQFGATSCQDLEIFVIEQKVTAYENFWAGFLRLLGEGYAVGIEESDVGVMQKPVLVVPGDTPLMRAEEISEFIEACTARELDYGVGMTEERFLRRYGRQAGDVGIEMNYLHLADGSYRLNNLHFARPFKIRNREYIEKVYEYRYQRQVMNMLRVIGDIVRIEGLGLRPVLLYIYAQLTTWSFSRGYRRIFALVRRRITRDRVTTIACTMLQANVEIVETTGGGCAIDVDNESDYKALCKRYDEFTIPS